LGRTSIGNKDHFSMVKLNMARFFGRGSESIGREIAFGNGVFQQINYPLEVQFLHDVFPVPASGGVVNIRSDRRSALQGWAKATAVRGKPPCLPLNLRTIFYKLRWRLLYRPLSRSKQFWGQRIFLLDYPICNPPNRCPFPWRL
jgi:hypothetical protein